MSVFSLRYRWLSCGAAVVATVLFCCAEVAGAEPHKKEEIAAVLSGLNSSHAIGQVAISPDGKRLAWKDDDGIHVAPVSGVGGIHVAPVSDEGGKSERVSAATKRDQHCREAEFAWSPDSTALAFFSDCNSEDHQPDLYLSHLNGSAARKLTHLDGFVDAPAFSPDGKQIAFLYVAGATRSAGATSAMKAPAGVIGEDGVEIQRVVVVSTTANAAAAMEVTPRNLHVYEFDWSPDSRSLAYVAANPPGENNWWVADIYTQALGGEAVNQSKEDRKVHANQYAVPRWSPDGKSIAFIGGLMSDQGSTGGDVSILPVVGENETPKVASVLARSGATAIWLEWGDNEHIFVSQFVSASEIESGRSERVRLTLTENRTKFVEEPGSLVSWVFGVVGDGRMPMSLSSTADRATFLFQMSSFEQAPEIYLHKDGILMQLSHFNSYEKPIWGKSDSLVWKSDDFNVQGWLLEPKNYDPAKRYPLIVLVHGGPAAAAMSRWGGGMMSATAFSALGYFVLEPNPRGSFGEGEAFTQANRGDFGYGDLRDILAGVDAVLAKYPVDKDRVGITGWSYGGFMSMFAVTQTDRFKAAVAGAGIANWQSYYGENSIDQWMIPYFGASVYDDPKAYAKSSAINFIQKAKTPTLVVVGDRDGECPMPQSFEFWHALRDMHVPTQLVVYPNEGHHFSDPQHSSDVMLRAVEWFEKYMPAK